MDNNIFKPRDFIYINQEKLNSYFSQLFGGLIRDINISETDEQQTTKNIKINAEIIGKFGLGQGSERLLDFILGYLGKVEGSLKGNIGVDKVKGNKSIGQTTSSKTLEHFQYSLLEESLKGTNYLIDLDDVIKQKKYSAEEIKKKLKVSHFVKYTTSNIVITDYRNALNFVHIISKIIDHSANYIKGDYIDLIENYRYYQAKKSKRNKKVNTKPEEFDIDENIKNYIDFIKDKGEDYLKKLSLAKILKKFVQCEETIGNGEKFEAILDVINDILSGQLIPLDILIKSTLNIDDSNLYFESQLKEKYLLEDRTDLSFKYGYFENIKWTIIGQITSTNNPSKFRLEETIQLFADNITKLFNDPNEIEFDSAVKGLINEIDILTKKIGLLPTVSENNISLTPIAIYIEPNKNPFLEEDK